MSLDDLQKTWQSQDRGPRPQVDADLRLKQVQRNLVDFQAAIFRRNVREVGAAAFLAVWVLFDALNGGGWSLYLLVAASIWVGGFILVDRYVQRRRTPAFDDSLLGWVEASLRDVEHQIWLLKNVWWWYLLPIAIGVATIQFDVALKVLNRADGGGVWLTIYAVISLAVFGGIYWLNQYAVRADLEPRRQELRAIRESLMDGDA